MRRLAWIRARALWALLSLAPCSDVAAQLSENVSIVWTGPTSCPRASFDLEVAKRIDAEARQARALKVDIHVAALAEGYELRVSMESEKERAERNVALGSCDDVRRAAAVLVATALTHDLEEPKEEVEEELLEEGEATFERAWALRLGLLADRGSLPALSGAALLGLGYTPLRRAELWLDLRYLAPRDTEAGAEQLRARLDLFAAALAGSYLWTYDALSVGPTVALELGALRGRVLGDRSDGSRSALWLSGWLGANATYGLGRASIGLSVLLGTPFSRPAFVWGDAATTYRTGALAARAELSFSVRLGTKKSVGTGQ